MRISGKIIISLVTVLALAGGLIIWPANAQADRSQTASKVTPLPRIHSFQHLQELLNSQNYRIARNQVRLGAVEEIAADTGMAAPEMNKADYSGTNVQVEGVDEADLVKTDGTYIYQVKPTEVLIIQALPASQMKVAARIAFDRSDFGPCEMYVADDKLVVIGNAMQLGPVPIIDSAQNKLRMMPPAYHGKSATRVMIYDIKNRNSPVKIRELELEGNYLTSRRVDSSLYVISQQPAYRIMEDNWLPSYRDSVKGQQLNSIPLDQIAYFPDSIYNSYLMMAGLRLDQPQQEAQTEVVLGCSENVYASASGLYVATQFHRFQPALIDRNLPLREEERTQLFRFSLDNGKITYTARGEVPGHTLNQFSMDEHQDVFRIATTSGQEWWRTPAVTSNNLYTLDSSLNILGRVENIAPGELIYSTRFMGDRAFMVTFRTVDPFFVIDLSTPVSPKVLGKLKIPGYSNYLHPYDENNIIGFGKDTIELKDSVGNPLAYYQGMKIAMFDVSNVASPTEKDREIIGDRGTDSELLNNHRALLFSREKNLLAFPVTVMEVSKPAASKPGWMPGYGSFTFQGAYVYQVNAQGFTLKGKITHLTPDDYLKAGDYWGGTDNSIRRILYIGNNLYTISDGMIQAHNIQDLKLAGSLPLK